MALFTAADNLMLLNVCLFNRCDFMAFETVATALRHRFRVRAMALDTCKHRFMTYIVVDSRNERGMASKAISRARRRYSVDR